MLRSANSSPISPPKTTTSTPRTTTHSPTAELLGGPRDGELIASVPLAPARFIPGIRGQYLKSIRGSRFYELVGRNDAGVYLYAWQGPALPDTGLDHTDLDHTSLDHTDITTTTVLLDPLSTTAHPGEASAISEPPPCTTAIATPSPISVRSPSKGAASKVSPISVSSKSSRHGSPWVSASSSTSRPPAPEPSPAP